MDSLPPPPPHNYVCLDCGHTLLLQKREAVKCPACGYRILIKLPSASPGATKHTVIAR